MNYQKLYASIIKKAISENRKKAAGLEKHHIIPDFMFENRNRKGPKGHLPGNPDCKNNLVFLTSREHMLCHILLAKQYRGTQYEYACLTSVLLMMSGGKSMPVERQNLMKKFNTKLYSSIRKEACSIISSVRKGTFPCKDVDTGEIVGSFRTDHPNVLSGKWVHHSKGVKHSDERKATYLKLNPADGENNTRFSGISNEMFFEEYMMLTIKMGKISPFQFFRKVFFEKHGVEFPKSLSKFRFNCGKEFWPKLEKESGFVLGNRYEKYSHKLNPRDFI